MKSLVVAPHPDDEAIGLGGTILKRTSSKKNKFIWLIMTDKDKANYSKKEILKRKSEIDKIRKFYKFKNVYNLGYPPASLEKQKKNLIIKRIKKILDKERPQEVFLPHYSDIHSDHRITFEILSSCTKNFRAGYIKKILCYQTISETNFNLKRKDQFFANYYEDISNYIKKKIESMEIYKSEIKKFPFPRSKKVIKSLAYLRGSEIGKKAAEAFEIIKWIN